MAVTVTVTVAMHCLENERDTQTLSFVLVCSVRLSLILQLTTSFLKPFSPFLFLADYRMEGGGFASPQIRPSTFICIQVWAPDCFPISICIFANSSQDMQQN